MGIEQPHSRQPFDQTPKPRQKELIGIHARTLTNHRGRLAPREGPPPGLGLPGDNGGMLFKLLVSCPQTYPQNLSPNSPGDSGSWRASKVKEPLCRSLFEAL
jgi:hypothetical protein